MLQIETPRLVLRPLCSEDALDITEATYETWDDLSLWMRWATDKERFTDIENCKSYADDCFQKFQDRKDFTFGGFIRDSGDFVLISRLDSVVTRFLPKERYNGFGRQRGMKRCFLHIV